MKRSLRLITRSRQTVPTSNVRRLVAALAIAASLSACGQKGPLYLPSRDGSVITRPAPVSLPTTVPLPPGTSTQTPTATSPQTPTETPAGTPADRPKDKKDDDESQTPK